MTDYKSLYLEYKMKYINPKHNLSGGANTFVMEFQKDIEEDANKWKKLVDWVKNMEDDDDISYFIGDKLGVKPDGEEDS